MKAVVYEPPSHRTVTLDDRTQIGSGGEAIIHLDPDYPDEWAIKAYREPDDRREQKVKDLITIAPRLMDLGHIIVPQFMVRDASNYGFLGFEMMRLSSRYRKLAMLFKSERFRRDFGFNTKVKARLLLTIGEDLQSMHHVGITVGDLNSGGILINGYLVQDFVANVVDRIHAWVDMDSVQFGKHPCMAGTVLYLHPELYGIQLDRRPVFESHHDTWAYTVMLGQGLLNGIHAFKSGEHPYLVSVQERAEAGVAVFDSSVAYPLVGLPPEVLTDELIDAMVAIFKRQTKGPFPMDLLRAYIEMLIECPSCGLWYPATRPNCPGCTQKTVIDMARIAKLIGFTAEDIIVTRGRILHYQIDGGKVFGLAEEGPDRNIVVYQWESGNGVRTDLNKPNTQGADFGFYAGKVVVCPDPQADVPELRIYDIGLGGDLTLFKATTTVPFYGRKAIWGTSNNHLYRIAGRSLVCGELYRGKDYVERTVMSVMQGQTWFTVSHNTDDPESQDPSAKQEMIFGFHRIAGDYEWFIVRRVEREFSRFQNLPLTPLERGESLLDFAVYFGSDHVLLARKTKILGIERTHVSVISGLTGEVINWIFEGTELWDEIHGKAYNRSRGGNHIVMHPTDKGIVKENLSTGGTQTLDVGGAVLSTDQIDRFGKGFLVVKPDRITVITAQ